MFKSNLALRLSVCAFRAIDAWEFKSFSFRKNFGSQNFAWPDPSIGPGAELLELLELGVGA